MCGNLSLLIKQITQTPIKHVNRVIVNSGQRSLCSILQVNRVSPHGIIIFRIAEQSAFRCLCVGDSAVKINFGTAVFLVIYDTKIVSGYFIALYFDCDGGNIMIRVAHKVLCNLVIDFTATLIH